MKAPNSKHQAPKKLQAPSIKTASMVLGLDDWSFSGAWMLVLGTCL
jgi:hypothetical protein